MADVVKDLGKVLYQTAAPGDLDIEYTSEEFAATFGGLFRSQGKLRLYSLRVYQHKDAPNWSIDIGAGYAVIDGPAPPTEPVTNAAEPLRYLASVPYANPMLNVSLSGAINTSPSAKQTHRVFLAVYDKNKGATLTPGYGAKIVVTVDTGVGAGVPQGGPLGYLQLGTVTVSPGQSYIGSAHVKSVDTVANSWRQRIAAGRVVVTVNKGAVYGTGAVTFPVGRFTATPHISLTQVTLPGGAGYLIPKATAVDATGFTAYLYNASGNPLAAAVGPSVDWIAVQEN